MLDRDPPIHGVPNLELDLLTPSTRAASDAMWASVRGRCPAGWTEDAGGAWVLTQYEPVRDAFRDWETFSSARPDPARSSVTVTQGPVPLLVPEEIDPPDWYPLRRVLAELLSPGGSEALRPKVRSWCHDSIDQFIEAGSTDLIPAYVLRVPVAVTMEFLGFPEEEWEPFAGAFHDVPAYPPGHPTRERALQRYPEVMAAISREVGLRIDAPDGDDALCAMRRLATELDISREMLEGLVFMVMGGGVDTTAALTGAAIVHLGQDDDLRAALRVDPTLLVSATEEFLRVYPPARTHARTVVRDVEFAGCPMKAGDRVILSEISANRDERAFPDPDKFVADRFPNRHVSFGVGIHRCPGSHLARIEFVEMMTALLDRLPDFAFTGEGPVEYPSWAQVGGWSSIPVTFTPGPVLGPAS